MAEQGDDRRGCGRVALVCEDDVLVRSIIAEILCEEGFEVLEEASAERATAQLERGGDIDLVITDIHLSGELTGLDLAHWITEHRPSVRVLAISGYWDGVMESSQPHRYAFLAKPFSPQVLLEHAVRLLNPDDGRPDLQG